MIIEHKALGMVQSVLGFQGDGMSQLIRLIEPVLGTLRLVEQGCVNMGNVGQKPC